MKKNIRSNLFYILFMSFFSLFLFISTITWTPVPMGESDDYMLATISLQYRGDLAVRLSDLEQAELDYPEFSSYLRKSYMAGEMSPFVDDNGGRYPWYFGTYSAICIPLKIILQIFDLPQIYTYGLTNCILYLLALCFIIKYLLINNKIKKILLLSLALNPAIFYVVWQSAEICIFSFVIISLVFWTNRYYKLAALFISLAGTLNSTVMVVGIFIIISFLIDLFHHAPIKEWHTILLKNSGNLLCLFICFMPSLIPFIYYYYHCGVFNLQVSYGFSDISSGYFGRFLAYLIDWNFGILPYFFIAFIFMFISLLRGLIKQTYRCYCYFLSFLGVIAAYSLMSHINCGMSGIARYNVWSAPIMLFGIAIAFNDMPFMSNMTNKLFQNLAHIGVLITTCIILYYGPMFAANTSDIALTPIAKVILNYCPQIYWSLPSTFNCRINHIPGGYDYNLPIIYMDTTTNIRKILVSQNTWDNFIQYVDIKYNNTFIEKLSSKVESWENPNSPHFISIPFNHKLQLNKEKMLYFFNSKVWDGNFMPDELFSSGTITTLYIQLNKGDFQYGPYITLPPGKYNISITGKNLENIESKITANNGKQSLEIKNLKNSDSCINYQFDLKRLTEQIEFVNLNNGTSSAYIEAIYIE